MNKRWLGAYKCLLVIARRNTILLLDHNAVVLSLQILIVDGAILVCIFCMRVCLKQINNNYYNHWSAPEEAHLHRCLLIAILQMIYAFGACWTLLVVLSSIVVWEILCLRSISIRITAVTSDIAAANQTRNDSTHIMGCWNYERLLNSFYLRYIVNWWRPTRAHYTLDCTLECPLALLFLEK